MNFQVASNYGEKIYRARKAKKMSRVELGELVGLHQTSVKKYEDGNIKNPSVDKLASFAKILDIPLLELLHFEATNDEREIYNAIPFYVDQIYSSFNQAIKGLQKTDLHKEDIHQFINKYLFEDPESPMHSYLAHNAINVYSEITYVDNEIQFSGVIDQLNNPYPHLSGELLGMKISDDSMNNFIKPGMYALIQKTSRFKDSDIILCSMDNQPAYLRKWYLLESDTVVLKPDSQNSEHKAQVLECDDINRLKIIGKYIGQISPMYS